MPLSTRTSAAPPPPQSNVNENCVGPSSEDAGNASSCAGCPNQSICASGDGAAAAAVPPDQSIMSSLSTVGRIILVLSGKGGVGKSTISAQFAWTLAAHYGYNVGLLDVDICGPSVPRMTGVNRSSVRRGPDGRWIPVYAHPNLSVMSIGFLTPGEDDAVVWRGPRKDGMIKQFFSEVDWSGEGENLDYLIVDTPPGTSDEHLSIVNHLVKGRGVDGAIIVTTSEEVSMADVRKELNFCKKVGMDVIGVVENMASMTLGFGDVAFHKAPVIITPMDADPLSPTKDVAPILGGRVEGSKSFSFDADEQRVVCDGAGEECTEEVISLIRRKCPELLTDYLIRTDVFRMKKKNDGKNSAPPTPQDMASKFGVPYLGAINLDRNLLECCDEGKPLVEAYPHSPGVTGLMRLVDRVLEACPPIDEDEEDYENELERVS